ncbi:Do family serine endopeptidase [Verrucomicrobiales bacterium]|nr:Do family serine endopeptidase [Verrucomicrobiales bacterium]MDC0276051.1 Do family serine endopeptidase [Verrucomicrobiales bacterium]
MKIHLQSFTAFLAAGVFAFSPVIGQEKKEQPPKEKPTKAKAILKFDELEKKISVDKSELAVVNGVMGSYAPALKKAMPAVVTIFSSREIPQQEAQARNPQQEELFRRMFPDLPEDFFEKNAPGMPGGPGHPAPREQGLGSGVIISEDGYILTNNHVAGSVGAELNVSLSSDRRDYKAVLIGSDPKTDIAIIKIDAKGLKPITIADSSKLQVGDVTMAVGNPFGLEQTVTMGIVSALGRSELNITGGGYENFIQTDASINRGNSGGALVDAQGRLIGINTAIQSGVAGGNIGIGFAIPANMALNIVERLLEGGGTVKRGFLGVFLEDLSSKPDQFAKALGRKDNAGVVVNEVGTNTPAEKAGLRAGDLIVKYNGKAVQSMPKLRLDISNTSPGTKVEFTVIRNQKEEALKVTLGNLENRGDAFANRGPRIMPEAQPEKSDFVVGVEIDELSEDIRKALSLDEAAKGVVVDNVDEDSKAADAGLEPGQVITQIDQQDITSVEQAKKIVADFKGDVLLLQIFTGGRRDILAIPVEKKDEE